ncbi:MAG TPA: hypothetical protein PLY70_15295 [Saprospiraceae bacterium]|nr:hypothetical protein [Saprospiraceae bacterium]HPN68142.1 hypothetical protein [Saprospiraceae bacterium]
MKKTLLWILVAFLLIVVIGGLMNDNNSNIVNSEQNTHIQDSIDNLLAVQDSIDRAELRRNSPYTWQYKQELNQMDGITNKYAQIQALDDLQFKFPYDGGSQAYLTIRRTKDIDVYLSISKGQFLSGYNHAVRLKFDEGKPITYNYQDPSDGSNETIFLNREQDIIKRLKSCSRLLIEVEFFDEGVRQLEFKTSDLNW